MQEDLREDIGIKYTTWLEEKSKTLRMNTSQGGNLNITNYSREPEGES